MRVLDHVCWMCGAGDTAKPPPLSLLLCRLSDLSVCFPLPTSFFAMYPQTTSPRNPISPEPVPLEILPLDHSLGNAGISLPHSLTNAIILCCPRSRQDRQVFLHLLASLTGESLSCALPWAVSEYKPHGDKDRPHGRCPGAASNIFPPKSQPCTGCQDSDGSCDVGLLQQSTRTVRPIQCPATGGQGWTPREKMLEETEHQRVKGTVPSQTGALGLVAGA